MATNKKHGTVTDPVIERLDENILKLATATVGDGSSKSKSEARRVARDTRGMREAFASLGMKAKDSEELAFHLAEVSEELKEVAKMLRKISKSGSCTAEQLHRLVSCVAVHWGYHLPKAKRILERVTMPSHPRGRISKTKGKASASKQNSSASSHVKRPRKR